MAGRKPPSSDGSGLWEFEVQGKKLQAIDLESLIKLVFEYRLRNGLVIGDIEREINNYYCSRWPQSCHPEPSDTNPAAAPAAPHESLLNRVTRWASMLSRAMPRGGYQLVSAQEAEQRASACHGCPKNQAWRNGCAGCSKSTETLLINIRGLRKTPRDGNLLACLACGHDNQTSVWLPKGALPELSDDQKLMLPARCWLK